MLSTKDTYLQQAYPGIQNDPGVCGGPVSLQGPSGYEVKSTYCPPGETDPKGGEEEGWTSTPRSVQVHVLI